MHRSGTSLAMALLRSAGVHIGERLLQRRPGAAEHGHAENLDFVDFHQSCLRAAGLSAAGWTTEPDIPLSADARSYAQALVARSAVADPWGWKDPRTTLFLDFWQTLLPDARVILLYRSPWEVVDSLYRRGDFEFFWTPTLALDIWIHYNERVLAFARRAGARCLLTSADVVATRPDDWLAIVEQRFGVRLAAPDRTIVTPGELRTRPPDAVQLAAIRARSSRALDLYDELRAHDTVTGGRGGEPSIAGEPVAAIDAAEIFQRWMESRRAAALRSVQ